MKVFTERVMSQLAALCLVFVSSAAVAVSEEKEIERGAKEHQKIVSQFGVYPDEQLSTYIDRVGQRLAKESSRPNLKYTFTVLNDDMINAFALPGGFIYITRGMLMHLNSESELAAVLGHEIAHVTEKHALKRETRSKLQNIASIGAAFLTGQPGVAELGQVLGGVLITGYSREFELEADEVGAQVMAKAGYAPDAMLKTIDILKNKDRVEIQHAKLEKREPRVYHGFLSSHPDNDTRYREAIKASDALLAEYSEFIRVDEFLEQLNGMAYGPSRQTGVLRRQSFMHPRLGLKLSIPAGWRQKQQRRGVQFVSQDGSAVFNLSTLKLKRGLDLAKAAKEQMGFQIREGKALTIGGMPAYLGIADRVDTPFGTRPSRLVLLADQRKGILYVGLGAGQFDLKRIAADGDFIKIIFSMERMARDDFQGAKPLKVQVVRAESGTTFESLAAASDLPNYALDQLRVINGLYPKGQPEPGQLIKIID